MSTTNSFILHAHYYKQIKLLNNEQRGILLTALFEYHATRETPIIEDSLVELAFSFIAEQMDYDLEQYEKKSEISRKKAKQRWDSPQSNADSCRAMQSDADGCQSMPNDANGCISNSNSNSNSNTNSNSNSNSDRESKGRPTGSETPSLAPKKENKGTPVEKAVESKAYGRYKNVMLTDEQHSELKGEFSDLEARIERLSEYMESRGVSYKNHAATIRAWSRNGYDNAGVRQNGKGGGSVQKQVEGSFDTDEFFEAALARSQRYLMEDSTEGTNTGDS